MLRKIIDAILPTLADYNLLKFKSDLDEIARLGEAYASVNQGELKRKIQEIRSQAMKGSLPEETMIGCFALVREVCKRVLNMRPFDVQMVAAIALHKGRMVELATGEGKTLAAVMPACLNAMSGQGVHILTFNDYLAKRDAEWMGPVYDFFGFSVGYVQEGMTPAERKAAYGCDVTYATAREAGFDYLRDSLAYAACDIIQRPFHYAIVDEADSILIDEARVPLVIAGDWASSGFNPVHMADLVAKLQPGRDFSHDEFARNAFFTEAGIGRLEKTLVCGNLYMPENLELLSALNSALHARLLLRRDRDYIVRDNEIKLVDELTGRVVEKRKWPHGLQTAVEAKEGVPVQREGVVLNSVTTQHFMQAYPKLAGMTATAAESAAEFREFYELDTVVVPPNRPCVRQDQPDIIFTHKAAKFEAIVKEVRRAHGAGQPVLIGTFTVEESESLAGRFGQNNIPCRVLNAKNDEAEAEIIAEAGALGAVTISTNMAGRGTDILLGGKDGRERERVKQLGGLYVIGTNRHESRRIDNQLRGRAGRQGDPGCSCFIISFEDDLMDRYRLVNVLPPGLRNRRQDDPVQSRRVREVVAHVQRVIEGQCFDTRRTLMKYALFVEQQRVVLHEKRKEILAGSRLMEMDRLVSLFLIDTFWSRHLARVTEIKESIHLVRYGGGDPLFEFMKTVRQGYEGMEAEIEESKLDILAKIKQGKDPANEGVKRPSATWTYLVNDNPFGTPLGLGLTSNAGIGFAVGTLIVGPLLWLGGMIKWIRDKLIRKQSGY